MSTLLRCCSLARLRPTPRLWARLPDDWPESFSSRLALRVWCEDLEPRNPPVLRFLKFALSSLEEVAEMEEETATAVVEEADDEEELNLAVELDEDDALPLCRVELLEVLAVLLADAEAEADVDTLA